LNIQACNCHPQHAQWTIVAIILSQKIVSS
jgi:hypothetical protein